MYKALFGQGISLVMWGKERESCKCDRNATRGGEREGGG